MRAAIVGAGVVGVAAAVAVKNAFPGIDVTVFAETFSPDTTGDGSAGLWGPYLLGDTPVENIFRWAGETHRWLEGFWKAGLAKETGLSLTPMFRVISQPESDLKPVWAKIVYGAHKLSTEDLNKLNDEHGSNYKQGWHFVTYSSEPTQLLPYLMNKFVSSGGKIKKRRIRPLHELADEGYELVINCSGLGARELVTDTTVTPIRGQVARVKAPWVMHGFLIDDDDGNYIIPNIENVVLGGTHQVGDFDCSVREEDTKFIFDGCKRIMPSLQKAETVKEWVGLRPGRSQVRLEKEICFTSNGKKYTVIHNYGHGGAGVTLCWGCALDVVEIIKTIEENHAKSKL